MQKIEGLLGERIRDVLARMVEHAPSYIENMNGVDLVIEAGTTNDRAVEMYEEAFRKRWNDPDFKLIK
jgi:hypothetical protein